MKLPYFIWNTGEGRADTGLAWGSQSLIGQSEWPLPPTIRVPFSEKFVDACPMSMFAQAERVLLYQAAEKGPGEIGFFAAPFSKDQAIVALAFPFPGGDHVGRNIIGMVGVIVEEGALNKHGGLVGIWERLCCMPDLFEWARPRLGPPGRKGFPVDLEVPDDLPDPLSESIHRYRSTWEKHAPVIQDWKRRGFFLIGDECIHWTCVGEKEKNSQAPTGGLGCFHSNGPEGRRFLFGLSLAGVVVFGAMALLFGLQNARMKGELLQEKRRAEQNQEEIIRLQRELSGKSLPGNSLIFKEESAEMVSEILLLLASQTAIFSRPGEIVQFQKPSGGELIRYEIPSRKDLRMFFRRGFLDRLIASDGLIPRYDIVKLLSLAKPKLNPSDSEELLRFSNQLKGVKAEHEKLWSSRQPFLIDIGENDLAVFLLKEREMIVDSVLSPQGFYSGLQNAIGFLVPKNFKLLVIPSNASIEEIFLQTSKKPNK